MLHACLQSSVVVQVHVCAHRLAGLNCFQDKMCDHKHEKKKKEKLNNRKTSAQLNT